MTQKEKERLSKPMTQEERELVLKDILPRLPYKTGMYMVYWGNAGQIEVLRVSVIKSILDDNAECRPFLRPMDDMTDEEKREYDTLATNTLFAGKGFVQTEGAELIDWLNAHHFDYRGLIPMGLAIKVNHPYNENWVKIKLKDLEI
jgi:hypothetical protein